MRQKLENFLIEGQLSLFDALQRFEQNSNGVLFVVDADRHLLGTITDGDIRRALLQAKSLGLSIRVIMNPNPITLTYGTDIRRSYLLLLSQKGYYAFVPVVDQENKVVDFASTKELFPLQLSESANPQRAEKTVLVVGGAGYIGSVLSRYLLEHGYGVKVFDAMLYGDDSIRDLYKLSSFECIVGDTRNLKQVYGAVQGVDAVIHLGEVVGDPACALDENYTTSVNHSATESLVRICSDNNVRRFIYASSCSVYGFGDEIFNEQSQPNPVSLYGKTKLECERTILEVTAADFCPTILRLSTVFGWSFRPRFDLVVNQFAMQAVTNNFIKVCGGDQWRPFVHVIDVVRSILAVLAADQESIDHQIFNVGGNELNMTIGDLGNYVGKVFPEAEIRFDGQDRDTRNYRVSFDKIRNVLGFIPRMSVIDGLRELSENLRNHGVTDRVPVNTSNVEVLYPGSPIGHTE